MRLVAANVVNVLFMLKKENIEILCGCSGSVHALIRQLANDSNDDDDDDDGKDDIHSPVGCSR